jgi:hypothetical protein
MLHLLQSLASKLKFLGWGLLRFLDEAVQNDKAPANQGAEERPIEVHRERRISVNRFIMTLSSAS